MDEAVHLRWTVRLVEDGRLGRILVDGKLLQLVLMSATVPWVSNPAWWGRATTVAVGALGLWMTWRIGERLFGPRVGWDYFQWEGMNRYDHGVDIGGAYFGIGLEGRE